MGRCKLSLVVSGSSVLERVVRSLREGGADRVLVIVGPDGEQLAALARKAHAEVLQLPEDTPDMRTTVQKGLDHIEAKHHPDMFDGWLLAPADQPYLDPVVVAQLITMHTAMPGRGIVRPEYQGRAGHPVLFRWELVPPIRALSPDLGLDAFIRQNSSEVLQVPVDTASVLEDLDTPEDYKKVKGRDC